MGITRALLILYLILGCIYAAYTYIKSPRNVFWLPINVMFGPLVVLYIVYMALRGKKIPLDW